MNYRGLIVASLLMCVLLAGGWFLTSAQDSPSANSLKIAFVSNRDGNEEIYVIPSDGSRDAINMSRNTARDWNPAWSPDGDMLAFNSNRDGYDSIYLMQQDGTRQRPLFISTSWHDQAPAWSPDGSRIAFVSSRDGLGWDLYTVNRDGEDLQRLTTENSILGDPAWSPDGTEIAYWLRKDGRIDLYKINVASGALQRLTTTGDNNGAPVWSPDGSKIFYDTDVEELWSIYSIEPNGNHPTRVSQEGFNNGRASFSPDGQRISFISDREISDEIFVMNLDGTGLRRLTENDASDHSPVWQPAEGTAISVIEAAPEIVASPTASNFLSAPAVGQGFVNGLDVHPISLPTLLVNYGFGAWHDKNWLGQGIRVGVIDTGFGRLMDFEQAVGIEITLPPFGNISDYNSQQNDHGTDVLEVIHAIAPQANFYVCRYEGYLESFQACTSWMREADVKIINHSAGAITLPLDGTNAWAAEVNDRYTDDILWVNSAGNFNLGFLTADFADLDEDMTHEFAVAGGNLIEEIRFPDISPEAAYSGNVMLSWERVMQANPETGAMQAVDLDLEVFALSDPSVMIGIGTQQEQRNNPELDDFERIYLSANEPFGIRVINRGLRAEQRVQMVLFVEFLPVDGAANRGSILTPADAENSLTVGAVQGFEPILANYSSRGVLGASPFNKPNISAPGEFYLGDGSLFVGTSAASPVIAGAAALLWQSQPNLYNTDIYEQILGSLRPDVLSDVSLGEGVFTMSSAPSFSFGLQNEDIVYDPYTIFPRPEELITVEVYQCIGAFPTRLEIGMPGYVSYNLGLHGRSGAGRDFRDLTGQFGLLLGTEFEVLGGPICVDSFSWWEIALDDGSRMWVAEGADYPFIAPRNLRAAQVAIEPATECPFAPPSLFEIRDRVITENVPAGGLTIWRAQDLEDVIGGLASGVELHLLGGPVCYDESKYQWFVRVLSGEFAGIEGFVSEAMTGERWLRAK